ncbi:MAG: hypothetical protein HBSAPP03_05400 [Phycisphaerae bacterium]|nr:MAG: hypothetical protein HBSAPP03_05400 [Phycisphaerae bacterium]
MLGAAVPGAVADFHPATLPRMARRTYALELTSTFFFALALTAIDGGVLAVLAKQTYSGIVPERVLNLCVGLLGAMDAAANILSFAWLSVGQGKPKIPVVNLLQVGVIATLGGIALLPQTPTGLVLLVLLAMIARSCWSGILTIRPTVWRTTYPASMRARVVGRFSTIQLIVVSIGGALLGRLLDVDRGWYGPAVGAAGFVALFAVVATSRIRVRREARQLRLERHGEPIMKPWHGPAAVWRVLRRDRRYAQFQGCMTVLGFANIMVNPILAITLKEQFGKDFFASILITSTLQQGMQIVAIPMWAKMLDRSHVVQFRAIHSWVFALSGLLLVAGAVLHQVAWFYVAAMVMGLAYGGGSIAWHLGHVDFAPPSETSQYMAAHVTLNGVRGLIAPFVSVTLYEVFKAAGWNASALVLGVSLGVSVAGAVGFSWLNASMKREMIGFSRAKKAAAS